MDAYSGMIAKTRYARYLDEHKRREHWPETVDRYVAFMVEHLKSKCHVEVPDALIGRVRNAILNFKVMPSMRLLMTAGEAVKRDNIAAYNCAYLAVNKKRKFSEALYILMNGTGVGFSCERQEIDKLPAVPRHIQSSDDTIVVGDSKLGWAKAYKKLIDSLYEGDIPAVDYSRIRKAGSRLKTFGGRASGPEPLRRLFQFTIETFLGALGRKLTSIEVHDIMCMIGEIVVVGGVRRSALISLSNLSDERMRSAKTGQWWVDYKWRSLANNSVAYTEKPSAEVFLKEWVSLVESKSGERGIFNRTAAQQQAAKYGRRDATHSYGCNPCSEIILRDSEFCNLTEVVVREEDTLEALMDKIEVATFLGTFQATLTDFQFISPEWKNNCEEERLLGVSLTGVYDHNILSKTTGDAPLWLERMREHAVETNKHWAKELNIAQAGAITCVKPSGTVSQLVNCASGIHPRHASTYIRNVRLDVKDPVCAFLQEKGITSAPDSNYPDTVRVFSFPMRSPEGARTRHKVSAIEHLQLWLMYQRYWCEHKPSVTINVEDHEWVEVGAFVYEHFDEMSGVAFLPKSNHSYIQAPYEDCTAEQFEALKISTPTELPWEEFVEEEDDTTSSQELSCTGGTCEIVGL